ncbi:MAG: helicase HerA-like domain-containing protein [Janthinobacterium lividum]
MTPDPSYVPPDAAVAPSSAAPAPLSAAGQVIAKGYTFDEPSIQLGVLVEDDTAEPDAQIRIPLSMLNRHGLVAGATGTGKTKTLQLMAEQISAAGVPVFAADIKGDLSGMASAGRSSDKLLARTAKLGQDWQPQACPTEFFSLGGQGVGVPLRATMSSFGPTLLSKVLGLNDVQESSLGLVFHYADTAGLPLLDLADLRAVLTHLTSDEGKAELKSIGGLSAATVGVILRSLITFSDQGADAFFGEPEFDTNDLLRVTADGRGVVSLLELPNLQDRPAIFSTFLMWLLADLFHDLPEVGDVEKPKLVFFFDEAHLLFADASKAFLTAIAQTVRLIRSKGVGIFFVTQTPKDVPDDVLAQLGSRVQHQLRAHTPNDAKALKQTVATFPRSDYDLAEVLQQLGIGEAVVTVMDPDGAPTPVAWTRMIAPRSLMAPTPEDELRTGVAMSGLMTKYGQAIDRDSAQEMLARKLEQGAAAAQAEQERAEQDREQARQADAAAKQARDDARAQPRVSRSRPSSRQQKGMVEQIVSSPVMKQFAGTAAREIFRGLFGTARRR